MNALQYLDAFVERHNGFRLTLPKKHVHHFIQTSHPEVRQCSCGVLVNAYDAQQAWDETSGWGRSE